MKIDVSKVKRWTILDVDGKLLKILDTSHTHTWRWWATYSFKAKNIVNGWTNTITYKASTTLETANVSTQSAVYLYNAWDTYSFMENDTSEIFELDANDIDDVVPYLKENLDVFLTIHEGNVLGVILPTSITYKVIETVPWVKWDRAQAGKKPAKLETWLEVMIPLYIDEWAEVTINTLTWDVS